MKKIIILGLLSLVSSVYATEFQGQSMETPPVVFSDKNTREEIKSEIHNESYLYEFNFGAVNNSDHAVHKYMTNNTSSVSTVHSLKETMKKNWHLEQASEGIRFQSSSSFHNQATCKYNNGLIVKVKAYGDYPTVCPLK